MTNPHKAFAYYKTEKHLRKLLLQLCDCKVKKKIEDVKYEGEEIKSNSVLTTSFKISESFTPEMIKYDKDQGRDGLDVFINKVFQLGYSIGYENSKESENFISNMRHEIIDELKEKVVELKEELKELKNENVVRSSMD